MHAGVDRWIDIGGRSILFHHGQPRVEVGQPPRGQRATPSHKLDECLWNNCISDYTTQVWHQSFGEMTLEVLSTQQHSWLGGNDL